MEDSETEVKQRFIPTDWEDDVPYGGKVYLARKKKPESWWIFGIEVGLILLAGILSYCVYYHYEVMYAHTVKLYAHMGYKEAQHQIGQRYLRGRGVEEHGPTAMHWFKKAAEQGHEHAAYNLAVAKLKGMHNLEPGETRRHLKHAASKGIHEAHRLLKEACGMGKCDD